MLFLKRTLFLSPFIFFSLYFLTFSAQAEPVVINPVVKPVVEPPTEFALNKLREAKVSSGLINLIERDYDSKERDRIVEMNIFGFLGKADYSTHYSKRALRKCKEFSKKYSRVLRQVERSTGVSKEVIAALLWVETKHGNLTGRHSLSSVFFSLLQADHPEVVNSTLGTLQTLVQKDDPRLEEYKLKVRERSGVKSNWALLELKALDQIFKKNPLMVKRLKGSFAGAFGYPQFIPSSYLQWARSGKKGTAPNLFKMEDAIRSVGFYLQSNGWVKSDLVSKKEALYHYNRAHGYGEVILKIAEGLSSG